jgi:hypothetical protein
MWSKKFAYVHCFLCWAGICLTYENQLAMKKEDTQWTTGRDVWWQVYPNQTSSTISNLYTYNLLSTVPFVNFCINQEISFEPLLFCVALQVCELFLNTWWCAPRMLCLISILDVMWNGLMQRIHCFFSTRVAAQENQRYPKPHWLSFIPLIKN